MRRHAARWVVLGGAAAAGAGCGLLSGYDFGSYHLAPDGGASSSGTGGAPSSASSASSASSTSGATGGTGGTGVDGGCVSAASCPAPADPCMQAACNEGTCGSAAVPQGGACAGGGVCLGGKCSGALAWVVPIQGAGQSWAAAVATTPGGDVIVGGAFTGPLILGGSNASSAGAHDGFVARLDAAGKPVWLASFGGAGEDEITSVAADASGSGNLAIAGTFVGTVNFGAGNVQALGGAGNADIFVMVLSAAGKPLWVKHFGALGQNDSQNASWSFDPARTPRVGFDAQGNVILAGSFYTSIDLAGTGTAETVPNGGDTDLFLASYGPSGAPLWHHLYGSTGTESLAGMAVDGSGNIALTGNFITSFDFDTAPSNALSPVPLSDVNGYLARFTSAGVYTWSKGFGISNGGEVDAVAVDFDASGEVLSAGRFFGGGTLDFGGGKTLAATLQASVFSAAWKLQPTPFCVWAERFSDGANDLVSSFAADRSAGGSVIAGSYRDAMKFGSLTLPANPYAYGNMFVVKLDPGGVPLWGHGFGGDGTQHANGVAVAPDHGVVVAGAFASAFDVIPGDAASHVQSTGGTVAPNAIVLKFAP